MKKRITDALLGATFVNGQILYDYDLNKIIDVLKEGVNSNKADLDSLITGNSDMLMFSVDKGELFKIKDIGKDGDSAINMIDGKVELIYKEEGSWRTMGSMSLVDLYGRMENLTEEIQISEMPPFQEGLKVWIKPIEEQIQEDPMAMLLLLPELEMEEEEVEEEQPELEIEEVPQQVELPELEIEEEETEEEPPELVVQSE